MTAKAYLSRVPKLNEEIDALREQIEEIETRLTSITADVSKEHVDGTKASGMTDGLLDKLSELTKALADKRLEAIITRSRVSLEIQSLENPQYARLLYKRYMESKDFETICFELCHGKGPRREAYELGYIYRLHGKALQEFAEQYKDTLNNMN